MVREEEKITLSISYDSKINETAKTLQTERLQAESIQLRYSSAYGTLVCNMYAYWQGGYREVGLPKLCALVFSLIRHHSAENSNYMRRISYRLPHFRRFLRKSIRGMKTE